jgi:hypothetical protein
MSPLFTLGMRLLQVDALLDKLPGLKVALNCVPDHGRGMQEVRVAGQHWGVQGTGHCSAQLC